jgi:hypothetical protein
MALTVPKFALTRKQILTLVGGVVVAAAAGWAALQYFEEAPPPPPPKPVTPAKQAGAAKAAPPAPSPDKLIADLLAASGLNQHLNQLPQQLIGGIKQSGAQPSRTSPAIVAAIETAVAESFTAQNFQNRLNADLNKGFDQKRAQALLADLSTPSAKSMIGLEQASPPPEEFARFVRSQGASRLTPARRDLILRIDTATRASELAVEAAFVSMKALAVGIVGAQAQKSDAIDKAIEKQRASATANIRSSTFANLAFTYRNASDADLETYAKFYETENNKWFSGLVYASLLEETRSAAAKAGERVATLASKPGKPGKPAMAGAGPARSKSRGDARACLDLAANAAVVKCAEQYR